MAGPNDPGELPPEVPPEYADAYRRAYERALRRSEGHGSSTESDTGSSSGRGRAAVGVEGPAEAERPDPAAPAPDIPAPGSSEADEAEPDTPPGTEPTVVLPRIPPAPQQSDQPSQPPSDSPPTPPGEEPTTRIATPQPVLDPQPAPRSAEEAASGPVWRDDVPAILASAVGARPDQPEEIDAERSRRTYLVPLVLLGLGLVLILFAYGVGRIVAGGGDAAGGPVAATTGEKQGQGKGAQTRKKAHGKKYRGHVHAAAVAGAQASCQSEDSVDAAGRPVSYDPRYAHDGDLSTAWRCDGPGVGQTFTINLARQTRIGQVGLVPGYAKTDPHSGVDRYAQNNRITRVRWVFDDGTTRVQRLSGSKYDRDLRRMRIPRTRSHQVTIEILASVPGPRRTVAISEVWVGAISR